MNWKIALAGVVILAAIVFISTQVRSTVHVSYTLNAPVERVWTYWADASLMQKFWGPDHYHSPLAQHDFKEGGKFIIGMQADKGGEPTYNAGTYTQIISQQKIVAEMSFSDSQGNILSGSKIPVPGNWPDVVIATIEFKPVEGGKTEVSVTEVGIPLIMKLFGSMGWKQQLGKLDKLLTAQ
jgi:uncharacterized protein YndB with AHSA1/START domain